MIYLICKNMNFYKKSSWLTKIKEGATYTISHYAQKIYTLWSWTVSIEGAILYIQLYNSNGTLQCKQGGMLQKCYALS